MVHRSDSSSLTPTPGRTRGRCTAHYATTIRCTTCPAENPDGDYYVMSRHADILHAARDHETFSSAQGLTVNYGELELIGLQDNPPMVMQDPPVHTEFRNWCRAVSPRARLKPSNPRCANTSSNGSSACAPTAAAISSPNCSSRCRPWWSRTTSGFPRRIASSSTAGPTRSSRPTPPRRHRGSDGTLGDALGAMMAYFTALIERRRREPRRRHRLASGRRGRRRRRRYRRHAVDSGVHLHDGHRRQRHHHRHARRVCATVAPPARSTPAAGRRPRPDTGFRRRVPAPDLAGARVGPHRHPRCQDGDTTIPAGRRVMCCTARETVTNANMVGRRRTRCHPGATQHPDLQPRRPPLPRRGRGPDAIAGRAHRVVGPLPRFRGRRVRHRLGRR